MRVLIIGRDKYWSAESAIYRALRRAGHTAAQVDDRRLRQWIGLATAQQWLRARVRAFRPDRIIVAKPMDVRVDVLRELAAHAPITMWYRDLRIPPEERVVERARLASVLFLTAGGQTAQWEALGVPRAIYLPDAADPFLERPEAPDPRLACDVAFIGRGYDDGRSELLVRLSRRFDVRVWGPGPEWERWRDRINWSGRPVYGREFARVIASARIVLGAHPAMQVQALVRGYTSNRLVKVLSCGGFYLAHATPGLDELFRDGEHLAWYSDDADAVARIEHYLRDAEARARIRAAARAHVLAHHTFDHRLENLLWGRPFETALDTRPASRTRPERLAGAGP